MCPMLHSSERKVTILFFIETGAGAEKFRAGDHGLKSFNPVDRPDYFDFYTACIYIVAYSGIVIRFNNKKKLIVKLTVD